MHTHAIRSRLALAAALVAMSALAHAGDNPDVLSEYVSRADPSYGSQLRREGEIGDGSRYVELLMTSQTWRGIDWRHQLFVIKPGTLDPDTGHALLMIDSGRWDESLQQPAADDEPLPRNADLFVGLAEHLRTPVAVLRQVPFQPLFDGLTEDRLIAHTLQRYLETGEDDWPLLLPMVTSAVRAMDTVQQHAADEWGVELSTFTVTGASKRGWTTWLTGAADERVTAIAPMVIDMLNTAEHLRHAEASWGTQSERISPYTELGLHRHLDTAPGRRLLQIVDPYSHRERLTQPKLIILGTNDEYWPVDALNLYWDGLHGDNRLLYVPNNGHRLEDFERVVAGVIALHQHASGRQPMPELNWEHTAEDDGAITLSLHSDPPPDAVRIWTADSTTLDMRTARWRPSPPHENNGGSVTHRIEAAPTRFRAVFAEVEYHSGRDVPTFLSTTMRVLEPANRDR